MSVVSWHSTVAADELRCAAVEDDEITFRGDAGEDSWSATERTNLPPAVSTGHTYRRVRVDLRVELATPPDGRQCVAADGAPRTDSSASLSWLSLPGTAV